jgi:hypothetical protein
MGLGLALFSTTAVADMPSCGGHHGTEDAPVDCSGAAVGASCTTAGANADLPGTCQLPTPRPDAGNPDGGAPDAGAAPPATLVCVAQPEQGSVLPLGLLGFVVPWLVAMLFPLLLRKRPKA